MLLYPEFRFQEDESAGQNDHLLIALEDVL